MRTPRLRLAVVAAVGCAGLAAPAAATPARAVARYPVPAHTGLPKGRTVDVALTHGHMLVHTSARPTTTVIVVLHGLRATPQLIEQQTGFSTLADRRGLTIAYPTPADDTDGSWDAGACCGTAASTRRDDESVIADAVSWLHVHRHRHVFLVGFSNGGMMAYRVAATRPDLGITGFGSVDGAYELDPGANAKARFTLLDIHGTEDTTVPLGGAAYSDYLAAPLRSFAATRVLLPNARLLLHTFDGGHLWPRTSAYDATLDLWAFFSDRSLFP